MRVTARRRSSASMTWLRATKTPPYGGVADLSRSATLTPLSVRASRDPLHGQKTRVAAPLFCQQELTLWGEFLLTKRSGGAELVGDSRQHAVDEAAGVLGGEALGELDGLRDGDGRGDVGA